jgi:hypothetical protein
VVIATLAFHVHKAPFHRSIVTRLAALAEMQKARPFGRASCFLDAMQLTSSDFIARVRLWTRKPLQRQWRGLDLNQRPSGYEPDELPDCSTPRRESDFTTTALGPVLDLAVRGREHTDVRSTGATDAKGNLAGHDRF